MGWALKWYILSSLKNSWVPAVDLLGYQSIFSSTILSRPAEECTMNLTQAPEGMKWRGEWAGLDLDNDAGMSMPSLQKLIFSMVTERYERNCARKISWAMLLDRVHSDEEKVLDFMTKDGLENLGNSSSTYFLAQPRECHRSSPSL